MYPRPVNGYSFKIFVFENGLEAAEWINNKEGARTQGNSFVLLLDLNMPGLDGWQFLTYFEKLDEKKISETNWNYLVPKLFIQPEVHG